MTKDNRYKRVITIVISILIVLILLIAISYAYFSTSLNGSDQIVKVGTLDLVLNETSEGINLEEAIGLSDEDGMALNGSTFELKNNGSKAVDYIIYLDDNTISDTDVRIDDMYLKYNLTKNGSDTGATLLTRTGANPNRVLDSGTIKGGGTNTYKLNLWITDEVDGNYSGQVFSGKLRVEVSQERPTVAETLLVNIPDENLYNDRIDTFITGEGPNNYIWYSGKLWRAVSINNEEKTVKLVTQWNISAINYDDDSSAFEGSYMEEWLNDTSVDGFLGNLRNYEDFIVTDAKWNATETTETIRPSEITMVTDTVGLLNYYEYVTSYREVTYSNGYLNNGNIWWTLTSFDSTNIRCVSSDGSIGSRLSSSTNGIRPSINLKSSVKIVDGNGTMDDPYRLMGDNDINLSDIKLNTRYSGEYIRLGTGENNLYRIVSHENGTGTKITSAEPLKNSRTFITINFGSDTNFSSTNTIGTFLNGEYLTDYVGNDYVNMIEDDTTWYLGTVGDGVNYKLSKYSDTNTSSLTSVTTDAKVGLLRYGELMSGQFMQQKDNTTFWVLTPYSSLTIWFVDYYSNGYFDLPYSGLAGIKPALNLKSNVIITSGDGTLQNPFEIALAS